MRHEIADLLALALVVSGQERKDVVAVAATQEPDQSRNPVRGDDIDPFVGGDRVAEELTDTGTLVVAGDPQVPRSSRSSRKTMRRAAWPGRG